ncbi:hypothetical protein [Micavibrio aeruginosavorus]|uniref:hypothetical protein n=1 Tax=Micavibrio aeruginosavorus TaxID=349221 RepID=UPI003F4A91A9
MMPDAGKPSDKKALFNGLSLLRNVGASLKAGYATIDTNGRTLLATGGVLITGMMPLAETIVRQPSGALVVGGSLAVGALAGGTIFAGTTALMNGSTEFSDHRTTLLGACKQDFKLKAAGSVLGGLLIAGAVAMEQMLEHNDVTCKIEQDSLVCQATPKKAPSLSAPVLSVQ